MASTEPPEPAPLDDSVEDGSAEDGPVETYPGAPDSLIGIWKQRRRRLKLAARDWFPPADLDLAPLLAARIPE
ncbi:MAG: hypothetical protein IT543_01335, partial [Tabrizicola sp.]|nr:hypothetical protein [Tabrizicola sp.]